MSDVRPEVQKGVDLLDKEQPGWQHKLSLESLDMWRCGSCVLGQLYDSYIDGLLTLGIDGEAYGFEIKPGDTSRSAEWMKLTEEWVQAIQLIMDKE